MNMPVLKESDRPSWIVGIASVVMSVALTFLATNYINQGNDTHEHDRDVENRLHGLDIEIAALKITTTAMGVEVKGTEGSIAQILASQNANAATLQALKDSDDARKEQVNEIKTSLASIIDILRPTRTFPRQ